MSESTAVQVQPLLSPIPMSFPAILRNSRLSDRYAYLRETETMSRDSSQAVVVKKKRDRDDREGKRWVRRRENARFTGNPYIVFASPGSRDIQIEPPYTKRTFPEPLPSFLPRSVAVPTPARPLFDPASANAGRYSISLRGMRRTLRGHGPRAEKLVRDIEKEVLDWLVGGTILNPDETEDILVVSGRSVGFEGSGITELSRSPLQLVWSIEQDAFARYIVHCCARYHRVVSYSKDVDERRLTYLLRPNVTRPDYTLRDALDTPPATESDYSLGVLSESDILSVEEHDSLSSEDTSDAEITHRMTRLRRLSSVSERSSESGIEGDIDLGLKGDVNDSTPRPLRTIREPSSSSFAESNEENEDTNDADDDRSIVNVDLAQSVESLDLNNREPPIRYTTPLGERTPLRNRYGTSRSSGSPSCSPIRRKERGRRKHLRRRLAPSSKQSFYDYLFS